ncbi:MAG TPA: hypothetical protein VMW42_13795 [Desulfatiglandales bacterium]|nr:hypothetical protein [Desulfatiglandales bacterium]
MFEPFLNREIEVEWWLYEHPDESLGRLGYCSGTDPVDHDNTKSDASSQAMYIMARQRGSQPKRIVARSFCKPTKATDFYEQAIMAQIYFNNHKNLIESNRNGMIRYYELNGFIGLLKEEPIPKRKLIKRWVGQIGARKNADSEREMKRIILQYTTDYCHLIPDIDLLDQLLRWGNVNTDAAVAFAWMLIHDDDLGHVQDKREEENKSSPWKMGYVRNDSGKIVRKRGS